MFTFDYFSFKIIIRGGLGMKISKEDVGERINQIRTSNGWTLEELGIKLNTSKVTVFNWERGRNLPNKKRLKDLADIAEITVDELLYGPFNKYIYDVIYNAILNNESIYYDISQFIEQTYISFIHRSQNLKNKLMPNEVENFFKKNIGKIVDFINSLSNDDFLYDESKVLELASQYINNLYLNTKMEIKLDDNLFIKLHERPTLMWKTDEYSSESHYKYMIIVEVIYTHPVGSYNDTPGTYGHITHNYESEVYFSLSINQQESLFKYRVRGLKALLNKPYSELFGDNSYEIVEQCLLKTILNLDDLNQYKLNLEDFQKNNK